MRRAGVARLLLGESDAVRIVQLGRLLERVVGARLGQPVPSGARPAGEAAAGRSGSPGARTPVAALFDDQGAADLHVEVGHVEAEDLVGAGTILGFQDPLGTAIAVVIGTMTGVLAVLLAAVPVLLDHAATVTLLRVAARLMLPAGRGHQLAPADPGIRSGRSPSVSSGARSDRRTRQRAGGESAHPAPSFPAVRPSRPVRRGGGGGLGVRRCWSVSFRG